MAIIVDSKITTSTSEYPEISNRIPARSAADAISRKPIPARKREPWPLRLYALNAMKVMSNPSTTTSDRTIESSGWSSINGQLFFTTLSINQWSRFYGLIIIYTL